MGDFYDWPVLRSIFIGPKKKLIPIVQVALLMKTKFKKLCFKTIQQLKSSLSITNFITVILYKKSHITFGVQFSILKYQGSSF